MTQKDAKEIVHALAYLNRPVDKLALKAVCVCSVRTPTIRLGLAVGLICLSIPTATVDFYKWCSHRVVVTIPIPPGQKTGFVSD